MGKRPFGAVGRSTFFIYYRAASGSASLRPAIASACALALAVFPFASRSHIHSFSFSYWISFFTSPHRLSPLVVFRNNIVYRRGRCGWNLIRLLLVITPTRAVVDLIVLLFDTTLVGDNTNKGCARNYCCVPLVFDDTNHKHKKSVQSLNPPLIRVPYP